MIVLYLARTISLFSNIEKLKKNPKNVGSLQTERNSFESNEPFKTILTCSIDPSLHEYLFIFLYTCSVRTFSFVGNLLRPTV